ncbi:hypothetical protein [Chitinophaga sancti]|uniref:Uncharacterized protein n=1 Tax=Chitinophaga sancti TaxID=1004 RepID=A0A1K1RWW3_9BACT|nr:hypothetical protein [Chitinophaga sancti]WQD63983.1 hypothetical protein U0033_06205 [Chitinophaga sancti]WQG90393.1 hypothetical protein SR876_02715 [Chitinophaga sancti]SFW76316.1 hypothetical protein SAMN05661012_04330 [Chitinophaga sancti]
MDAKELLSLANEMLYQVRLQVFGESFVIDGHDPIVQDLKKLGDGPVEQCKVEINFQIDHCKSMGIDPIEIG